MDFFTRINDFLDQDSTITVLRALVLLMVLAWLLSGGFGVGRKRRKPPKDDDRRGQ